MNCFFISGGEWCLTMLSFSLGLQATGAGDTQDPRHAEQKGEARRHDTRASRRQQNLVLAKSEGFSQRHNDPVQNIS